MTLVCITPEILKAILANGKISNYNKLQRVLEGKHMEGRKTLHQKLM